MSTLAMQERDFFHYNFYNSFNLAQSHDFSKCNNGKDSLEAEERLVRQHNLLKGSKITNKNCHYIPFNSPKDEWNKQFPINDLNLGQKMFNIQTKRRFN